MRTRKIVNISLPTQSLSTLDTLAQLTNRTRSGMIDELIGFYQKNLQNLHEKQLTLSR